MIRLVAMLLPLCLMACGSDPTDGAGGVSASEASALNQAAAQLDAQKGAAEAGEAGLNPAAVRAAQTDRDHSGP